MGHTTTAVPTYCYRDLVCHCDVFLADLPLIHEEYSSELKRSKLDVCRIVGVDGSGGCVPPSPRW
jgi:hypothetical protein